MGREHEAAPWLSMARHIVAQSRRIPYGGRLFHSKVGKHTAYFLLGFLDRFYIFLL